MQDRIKWVLAALVLAHMICFSVSLAMLSSSIVYVDQIDYAGDTSGAMLHSSWDVAAPYPVAATGAAADTWNRLSCSIS